MVQVILKETILGLGQFGQVVDVRPGYARNFLVPGQKALPVTEENRAMIESQRVELEAKEAERRAVAKELAKNLSGQSFSIQVTTSDGTRLYGSIGVTEIQALLAKNGHQIEKRSINVIDGPIREIGQYQVLITYHADVQESITVNILSDGTPKVIEEDSEYSEG